MSDRGAEYCNDVMDGLCKLLEIDHRFASVQTPQSNSGSEVLNKRIASYLKAMLKDHPTQLETLIPSMQFSYNSEVTRATKMSPFYYGHSP